MRLDRLVATATGRTRQEAARLIARGEVLVDGVVVRRPAQHADPAAATVTVAGTALTWRDELTLLMHKPAGVVSATEDPSEATVLGLVPPPLRRRGLAPVGRLDKDTTGLLLLTTDGELNHRLTHPRRHLPRTYLAQLAGELAADAAARFEAGVELRDGTVCRPAVLERLGADRVRITVRQGRYHQVKRMVAACGARVVTLHREGLGALALDPTLAPGQVRLASAAEIAAALRDPEAPAAASAAPPGGGGGGASDPGRDAPP